MRGISGFFVSSLADDTFSSITPITNTAAPSSDIVTKFSPFPANCLVHAVEVVGHRSGTFSQPVGASITVDLFRGSAGQLPLRVDVVMSVVQHIATVGSAGLASFSGWHTWDRPWHFTTLGLAQYTGLSAMESEFGHQQARAVHGRVKMKVGGTVTLGLVAVHWETISGM